MEKTMESGLKLNLPDRKENPMFEAHDPGMMKDPVSGYYYCYSTDTAITSDYCQGIQVRKSRDLVHFTYVGTALSKEAIKEGRDNGEYPPTEGFWAPFTEYVNGEYRMYYSATKAFGSSESRIWLAVAKHPEGPFENRGLVADTWFTTDREPNAIDAHIIDDAKGRKYMVYGSFFGGIYIKELNPEDGMPMDGNAGTLGKRIAVKPEHGSIDGPEGAAVVYHKESGYYYLFLSYGWLGENYDIRAGRSMEVTGPYVDYHGNDLNGNSYGLKIANSYCFKAGKPYAEITENWTYDGFRGPGHGVPFYEYDCKEYFFVHHIRDGAKENRTVTPGADNPVSYRMHYMMVRKMEFINGWPVLSPENYAGEEKYIQENVDPESLQGNWEWIFFDDRDNDVRYSFIKPLEKELENAVLFHCFDIENSIQNLCLSGIDFNGVAFWAKKCLCHSTKN